MEYEILMKVPSALSDSTPELECKGIYKQIKPMCSELIVKVWPNFDKEEDIFDMDVFKIRFKADPMQLFNIGLALYQDDSTFEITASNNKPNNVWMS